MKIALLRFVLPALLAAGVLPLLAGCPASEETATDAVPTTTASVTAVETPAPVESTDGKVAGPPPPPGPAKDPGDFDKKPFKSSGKVVKTASGLQYDDMTVGTGKIAEDGKQCVMHYTGTLQKDGSKFDSSRDRGDAFKFVLGTGSVIKGWDEGVKGMKVGGRRKLIIPAGLGYGEGGQGPIPGGATLVFDVELMDIQDAL